ncbi:MAG: hypothetical protein LBS32_03680 [Clostridiales Family XIII bacterium]|nr:hypothetical protein [Clostridiales Family XIII bacterium]
MTNRRKTPRPAAALLLLAIFTLALQGCGAAAIEYDENGDVIMPLSVRKIRDTTLEYAVHGGISLNGKWGEWHKEMIASGRGRRFDGYSEHLDSLKTMLTGSRARAIDIIYADDPEAGEYMISMGVSTKKKLVAFGATADAGEFAVQAMGGVAAVEPTARYYASDDPCWSAYAPIYDAEGAIVAVLKMVYPAQVVLAYPEWNRDDRKWNGYTGATPAAISASAD